MTKKLPLPPLTPKEKSVLEFIESHILSSGVSPSYQEIKDHFGLASFNSVQNYLKQLTSKGYIENPLGQKRAIQVLHSASAVQEHLQSKKVSTTTGSHRSQLLQARDEVLSLPLLGKVAAGQPIEAIKHDEFVDVPPSMIRNPSKSFALKVQGDSMIEDGIFDEDIILVQKQDSASNGDIVVATVENEATVKRIYVRARPDSGSSEKLVELRPSNSTMKSMWYSPEEVEIRGIVVGLIRKFQ
ncbi:repressor LexA [Bdellovibrio bacteriovorus]|uniref:LexA repressor n=1 Tax=Bdellovibrio bacteriovorus TaxID=959 RepID=A0A150WVH6_BDEBC|nr:transcriptional repressor LexA [Bdellovibrio bacteriovorus]KYG68595.1 repressor LexA [Bdellovibrio bacteriovorus]KYG70518.1 repressor LexA [Bdellovibrio bacteriovorus]